VAVGRQTLAAEGRETIYVPSVVNSFLPLSHVVRQADRASLFGSIRPEARSAGRRRIGQGESATVQAGGGQLDGTP
jgi:hypothetical protein